MFNEMIEAFRKKTEALSGRETDLEQRRSEIIQRKSKALEIFNAQVRVLERKADDLTAKEDLAGARTTRTKIGEIRRQIKEVEEQYVLDIGDIQRESLEIDRERRQASERVYRDGLPLLARQCHEEIEKAVSVIDAAWAACLAYSRETGYSLPYSLTRDTLKVLEYGETKALYKRLVEWL